MEVIERLEKAYPVAVLCRLCGVARSSYYASRAEQASPDPAMLVTVRAIQTESRCSIGSRRMVDQLRQCGHTVGRHRARTLMRQAGANVAARHRPPFRRAEQPAATAPNRLDRQFNPSAPNRIWAGDITYLRTACGWLYLAIVVDLYARRVVGWAFSAQPNTDLVLHASTLAIDQRRPAPGLLFHSDQGCQYTSDRFVAHLAQHAITQSMSRRGNCWDNAVVERVFRSLKHEWIGDRLYRNLPEAQRDITDYIARYYNHHRPHTAAHRMPPALFEARAH